MRILFIIIIFGIFFSSCGVKDRPEYKTQIQYNNSTYKI